MARMRISVPLDTGTLSASSARADFAVTQLYHPDPGLAWSPLGLTGEYIAVDYGASPPLISCMALLYTNLRSSRSIRARASNSGVIGAADATPFDVSIAPANGLNSAARDDWTDYIHLLGAAVQYRYWRFDIADAGHPDGALSVGRLVMDRDFETMHDYGADMVADDYGIAADAPDGRLITGPTLLAKRIDFSVSLLPVADMASRWQRVLACGRTTPLLLVQDPDVSSDRQDKIIYGVFRQRPSVPRVYNGFYAGRFELRGLRP
jgi:hypothetical protein